MKPTQYATPPCAKTTSADVSRWAQALWCLHARLAPRFARPEPYQRALSYLQGILSDVARKNGWQLAEQAGEARPDGMQRLLSSAVWDTEGVRDDLRTFALQYLGQESANLVIDETSFPKRGKKSAGVGVQYCGTTGQVQNCQIGVFLSYVTAKGHTLIDRELYLPLDWCQDQERCRDAGVPEPVRFRTKPELAIQMLKRLQQAQIPIAWVVADTVYGSNWELRTWLETHQFSYVLAVACTEQVGIQTHEGGRRLVEVRDVESLLLQAHNWQRLAMSEGTRGPRLFDWACVPLLQHGEQDGRHWLLLRRCLSDPKEITYALVFAPQGTTLPELVQVSGTRWRVEEDFENAKNLGLDHYEVRCFLSWYRHITLVLLALAFLTSVCVTTNSTTPPAPWDAPVLPLTVPEVHHLLARLIWPQPSAVRRVLAWSWWRRCHQGRASVCHGKHRLKAG